MCSRFFLFVLWAFVIPSVVFGQIAEPENDGEQDEVKKRRATYMMEQCMGYVGERESDGAKLTALEAPLLRWTNPSMNIQEGLFVGWTDPEGRPAAVAQIYLAPWSGLWCMEHQSLCDVPIEFRSEKNSRWSPKKPGMNWQAFSGDNIPKPAKTERLRLAQMRALGRRFSADDAIADNVQLRLMPTPLHRYKSEKSGIVDGALFAMVSGTDPEITLQIEAREDSETGEVAFYWAMTPMTTFELTAHIDDEQVWHMPKEKSVGPNDTFYAHELTDQVVE